MNQTYVKRPKIDMWPVAGKPMSIAIDTLVSIRAQIITCPHWSRLLRQDRRTLRSSCRRSNSKHQVFGPAARVGHAVAGEIVPRVP